MTTPAVAILVPVLRRPHRVRPLLDSIAAATPEPYHVLFVCDPGDNEEMQAIRRDGRAEILVLPGNYATKINAGIRHTTARLLFLGADDILPHRGWSEAAVAAMEQGPQVVGVNDLRPRDGEHATHFLLTREAAEMSTIDGFPGPLCDSYVHNFPDRELIETARRRGAYVYARESIVEHLHCLDGKAEHDSTYAKGEASFRRDRRLFNHRSVLWT